MPCVSEERSLTSFANSKTTWIAFWLKLPLGFNSYARELSRIILERLYRCLGSSEPLLRAHALTADFPWRGAAVRWALKYSLDGKPILFRYIGIKHGFSCIIARFRGRCWKPRPKAAIFNTSQGTWRMFMHWKTMFDCYYCIKTENICYISRYFLHYFVSPLPRCRANAISMDYARSRAGEYTSRDGSNSGAPVRAYWKFPSRELTARELPC